jgi:hypothetical protein
MRINQVKLIQNGSTISLVANCHLRHFGQDQLYFSFDRSVVGDLSPIFDPFAAALLVPAMKKGEDLIINGVISKTLYEGMQSIIKIMAAWDIDLHPIKIKVQGLIERHNYPSKVGVFFSGGVDSFYSYLTHKDEGVDSVSELIVVNGFDIDLRNKDLWQSTQQNMLAIGQEESKRIILVETNLRRTIEPIVSWDYSHGGSLAAVALCLQPFLKHVYIASSYPFKANPLPSGSGPKTDRLWGTESLSLTHDGDVDRLTKVLKIAPSKVVQEHLRVCYMNVKGDYNCGKCDKCLRTMISLKIAGVLSKCRTFPTQIDMENLKKLRIEGIHGAIFHQEILNELVSRQIEPEIQSILKDKLAHVQERNKTFQHKLLNQLMFYDYQFLRGSIKTTVAKLNPQGLG